MRCWRVDDDWMTAPAQAFAGLDRDHSTFIERKELEEGLRNLGLTANTSAAELDVFFSKFDTDGNGACDRGGTWRCRWPLRR